jgi:hypothetical protein
MGQDDLQPTRLDSEQERRKNVADVDEGALEQDGRTSTKAQDVDVVVAELPDPGRGDLAALVDLQLDRCGMQELAQAFESRWKRLRVDSMNVVYVGSGHEGGRPARDGSPCKLDGGNLVHRPVINARKNMSVQVDHRSGSTSRLSRRIVSRALILAAARRGIDRLRA